jgi:Zn finger protein HypA/HybF involved in hydrogenase expression
MMRGPFSAFADPKRRPRAIVLTLMILIAALGLYAASMTVTSSTWFCNDVCHNVHADNKRQWQAGSHSEISCMACHYPVRLDPLRFALDRVDKLLDVYPTVTNTFEMPLNRYSRMALEMPSAQCTQCHSPQRQVTPTRGLIIDHEAHANRGINCTVCHNRVAHPQKFPLTIRGNAYAEDFMTMRACFRCHTQSGTGPSPAYKAPGACPTCHTAAFDLVPASHGTTSGAWTTPGADGLSGHAKAAREDSAAVTAARADWAVANKGFIDEEPRIIMQIIDVDTEKPIDLPPAATVGSCDTCHVSATFCDPCHARNKVTVTP